MKFETDRPLGRPGQILLGEACRRVDVIVPEYNEFSKLGDRFYDQLCNLENLARQFNVFLIDDCSTDGSWERLVKVSKRICPHVHLLRMEKNGNKIFATRRALQISAAEFVILTDFDSTISNPEDIQDSLEKFDANPKLAGMALRLLPDGNLVLSKLQDMEYAFSRAIFSRYMGSQQKLRCIPGAAGLWRRKILLEALEEHSGRHNGDDLEATVIALRKGYSTQYERSIVVRTIVPKNTSELFKQRRRWELGVLETYEKERKFFVGQVKNLHSRLGHVALLDLYTWTTLFLLPFFIITYFLHPIMTVSYLVLEFVLIGMAGYVSRSELQNKKELVLLPLFPVYLFLVTVPRFPAMYQFLKCHRSKPKNVYRTVEAIPAVR